MQTHDYTDWSWAAPCSPSVANTQDPSVAGTFSFDFQRPLQARALGQPVFLPGERFVRKVAHDRAGKRLPKGSTLPTAIGAYRKRLRRKKKIEARPGMVTGVLQLISLLAIGERKSRTRRPISQRGPKWERSTSSLELEARTRLHRSSAAMPCASCVSPSDQFTALMKKFGKRPMPTVPTAVIAERQRHGRAQAHRFGSAQAAASAWRSRCACSNTGRSPRRARRPRPASSVPSG